MTTPCELLRGMFLARAMRTDLTACARPRSESALSLGRTIRYRILSPERLCADTNGMARRHSEVQSAVRVRNMAATNSASVVQVFVTIPANFAVGIDGFIPPPGSGTFVWPTYHDPRLNLTHGDRRPAMMTQLLDHVDR